jgi:hypothetical protein
MPIPSAEFGEGDVGKRYSSIAFGFEESRGERC